MINSALTQVKVTASFFVLIPHGTEIWQQANH